MIYMNILILLNLLATNELIQLNVNTFRYIYEIFLLDYNDFFNELILQPISISCIKTNIKVVLPKMLVLSLLIKRI